MFAIGDTVVFALDGARGIVYRIDNNQCHVLWEDYFVSWEKFELLTKDESVTKVYRYVNQKDSL